MKDINFSMQAFLEEVSMDVVLVLNFSDEAQQRHCVESMPVDE